MQEASRNVFKAQRSQIQTETLSFAVDLHRLALPVQQTIIVTMMGRPMGAVPHRVRKFHKILYKCVRFTNFHFFNSLRQSFAFIYSLHLFTRI